MTIPVALPQPADLRRTARRLLARLERLIRPAKAPLRNLAAIPLTALGVLAFDAGVFQWSARVGWMVTGLSLIILEHVIADEE